MADIDRPQRVVVTDVSMPFGSMVVFMVKWAIAAIPAIIILVLISAAVWFLIGFSKTAFLGTQDSRNSSSSPEFTAPSFTPTEPARKSTHDPEAIVGSGKAYVDSRTKLIHQPRCRDVASHASVSTWSEALNAGYKSHQCVVGGE